MSDETLRTTPVELRAPRDARVLEIDWADGTTSRYRHVVLRAFCPCAHCQGHQGPVVWPESAPKEDLALLQIEEVGSYAIRLVWSDAHGTGIYTFAFLRALGELGGRSDEELKGVAIAR